MIGILYFNDVAHDKIFLSIMTITIIPVKSLSELGKYPLTAKEPNIHNT